MACYQPGHWLPACLPSILRVVTSDVKYKHKQNIFFKINFWRKFEKNMFSLKRWTKLHHLTILPCTRRSVQSQISKCPELSPVIVYYSGWLSVQWYSWWPSRRLPLALGIACFIGSATKRSLWQRICGRYRQRSQMSLELVA